MFPYLNLLPLFLLSLTIPTYASQTFKTLIAPITQSNNFFTITLNQNHQLLLDIESPLSWLHCRLSFPRVSCRSPQCYAAQSVSSSLCNVKIPEIPSKPFSPVCPCFTLPYNPITNTCASSELTYTHVSMSSTTGFRPLDYMQLFVSCAPRSLHQTLPKDCLGVASLSKAPLSLVSQFSNTKISRKFGMCLGNQGVGFFGEIPFYLLPNSLKRNVSRFLNFTPLLNHPSDNSGYYIGVEGIFINSQPVNLPKNLLLLDGSVKGGVKLSTITRYTTITSDIYRPILIQFERAVSGKIPRAPSIAPFDMCFKIDLGTTRVGFQVPQIRLRLSGGVNWISFGANSVVQVSSHVACLAFVDAGEKAEHAIVIGSYQMQHHFMVFDLELMRLGFSPSLLALNSSCNDFDFTFRTTTQ